eukprot:Selendium_serpulae@DN4677_c0_g1_i1.p1
MALLPVRHSLLRQCRVAPAVWLTSRFTASQASTVIRDHFSYNSGPTPAGAPQSRVAGAMGHAEPAELEALRRCVLYRSRQRGLVELDLMLGSFAQCELTQGTPLEQLAQFTELLEEENLDVLQWIMAVVKLQQKRQREKAVEQASADLIRCVDSIPDKWRLNPLFHRLIQHVLQTMPRTTSK